MTSLFRRLMNEPLTVVVLLLTFSAICFYNGFQV
jgi:hypothetical protein